MTMLHADADAAAAALHPFEPILFFGEISPSTSVLGIESCADSESSRRDTGASGKSRRFQLCRRPLAGISGRQASTPVDKPSRGLGMWGGPNNRGRARARHSPLTVCCLRHMPASLFWPFPLPLNQPTGNTDYTQRFVCASSQQTMAAASWLIVVFAILFSFRMSGLSDEKSSELGATQPNNLSSSTMMSQNA